MNDHDQLATAMKRGDIPAVLAIIKRSPEIVNSLDWTPPPLHCAVLWDQPEVADILLSNGADIEMQDPDRSTTPLRYAVLYAKPRLVRLLIARGANTGRITDDGITALQLAMEAQNGRYAEFPDLPRPDEYAEIVELLQQIEDDGPR